MPPESFLHEIKEFRPLIETAADEEKIDNPALVEKDYWIMHSLFGLKRIGLTFELKGGTSLSKGFGIIHRFSEDLDIRIEPFDGLEVDTNPNHDKSAHVETRNLFFEKLREKIQIPGIVTVERDKDYDDETLRNAGLRLRYESHFESVPGLKDGILLEVGFDKTAPNRPCNISSWVVEFATKKEMKFTDNRASEIPCYNAEYTFVEKLQTVLKKYRQFRETGKLSPNFLRHYYDIHQLLDVEDVQKFIGTEPYREHKRQRFKSLDQNVKNSGAFTLEESIRKKFEQEYEKTASLYYRGQIPLDKILSRIQKDLERL
jgi:predicted nucleotidyltransferase component of viral defense system